MNAITDLIIRIKNGYMAGKDIIESPYSTYREEIVKKLMKLGYVKEYHLDEEKKRTMDITLLYHDGIPALTQVKIFSTPGRRWYISSKELKSVLGGMGYSIISTPKGILTNIEAKKHQVGGELLFNIW